MTTPTEVLSMLRAGPERIRTQAGIHAAGLERLAKTERDLELYRLSASLALTEALQGEGKKTNADQREGMLEEAMMKDPHHERLAVSLKAEVVNLIKSRLELEFEQNLFDAARAMSRILGGREA